MEFNNFIHENKIDNFDILKIKLENDPYNLKFKFDDDYPNLVLIYIDKNSDLNNIIVNICNGIIIDKNTLKIVCYTFNKCSNQTDLPENLCKDNLYVETALEGTLLRMYYYDNKWMYSTKKCIDATKAKWLSDKNFLEMFKDCIAFNNRDNIENILDKNNCYSFIITHPENNIVTPYSVPIAFHISTRNMNNLYEISENIGFPMIEKKLINKDGLSTFFSKILNDTSILYEGFIFIDTNYNRWKIKTPVFNKVRELWGNTNNRFLRYLELRKDPEILKEYIIYYPYDKVNFLNYEKKIVEFAKFILTNYIEKHITKKIDKIPSYLAKVIYKLHGNFFKDKIRTDCNKIMDLLLTYDAKYLCYIMNFYNKDMLKNNDTEINENKNEKLYDDTYIEYEKMEV